MPRKSKSKVQEETPSTDAPPGEEVTKKQKVHHGAPTVREIVGDKLTHLSLQYLYNL